LSKYTYIISFIFLLWVYQKVKLILSFAQLAPSFPSPTNSIIAVSSDLKKIAVLATIPTDILSHTKLRD
jgi:hypothetical protein